MSKNKVYSSEQAIPAWMKVKDTIVETEFDARRILAKYRASGGNPSLFHKLKDKVVSLYDMIRADYDRDAKLKKRYPKLSELSTCLMSVNVDKDDKWWIEQYKNVTGVVYDLGITKITRDNDDDDDDLAGWEDY